jgi:hypothetical protein
MNAKGFYPWVVKLKFRLETVQKLSSEENTLNSDLILQTSLDTRVI